MLHRRQPDLFCIELEIALLDNIVEVDETFIGGKNKNRYKHKQVKNSQGRSIKDKVPVFVMIERGDKFIGKVVPNTRVETLIPEIIDNVKETAIIMSDEWQGYSGLHKFYNHSYIQHHKKEYVKGITHTNTVENCWSLFKRGIIGIYHHLGAKNLDKYVNEFGFRYNSRDFTEFDRFNWFFVNMKHRLKYRELIG